MATGSYIQPEEGSPSFFKVIRYPSAPHLSLPKAFVRKFLEKIPRNPTLVTATGKHSWRLEFVKIGEDYCFAHGWEKLVEDVQLCIRDIVVFWLIDPSTFLVTFLGTNGCEKDLPVIKTNDDDVNDNGHDDHVQDGNFVSQSHDDEVMSDKNLCFEKVFSRKTYKYYMSLPMSFVKAAGLQHKESIKLMDHEGKEWTLGIIAERYSRTKYSLSKGWLMFRRHHKLSDGDVCEFMFNKKEDVLNLTRIIRTKRSSKQETPMDEVNGKKGRPSCGGGGVKVKIEYESGQETEVVKRKRETPQLKSCANVKIEDESDPVMVVEKGKRGMPPLEKPSGGGGVEVTKPGTERVFRSKHVIYF
ncbi:hypothetical protein L1987_72851 [Smallanthus sonchifolius]|uniref:Uncharacterized protein n=1 Tax=Smallanthus sonchifolius TaxID=185202 RepID=A0ACB9AVG2_9ASTR|nr:hypothetical protein L1987_72851 [Smallanthus sonchifolius]